MTVIASNLIASETLATKEQLWTPSALVVPDWSSGVIVRTQWPTAVSTSRSAAESRLGTSAKPIRVLEYSASGLSGGEAASLASQLRRAAMARSLVPLWSDQVSLTAAAATDDIEIAAPTRYRRFYPGGRILVGVPSTSILRVFEIATIDSVDPDAGTIGLAAPLVSNYAAGSIVAPFIEAELVLELSRSAITDDKASCSLSYRETTGASTLDPFIAPGATAGSWATYEGLPIMPVLPHWSGVQHQVSRPGETSQLGNSSYTEVHGVRFRNGHKHAVLQMDRASAWQMQAFFDSRGGRRQAFFAVSPMREVEYIDQPSTTTIRLLSAAPLLDLGWISHFAIVLKDGTTYVRRRLSVSRLSGVDTITFTEALPEGLVISYVTAATKCRFAGDELVETWRTDSILSTEVAVTELLEEKSITVDLPPLAICQTCNCDNIISVTIDSVTVDLFQAGTSCSFLSASFLTRIIKQADGSWKLHSNGKVWTAPASDCPSYNVGDWTLQDPPEDPPVLTDVSKGFCGSACNLCCLKPGDQIVVTFPTLTGIPGADPGWAALLNALGGSATLTVGSLPWEVVGGTKYPAALNIGNIPGLGDVFLKIGCYSDSKKYLIFLGTHFVSSIIMFLPDGETATCNGFPLQTVVPYGSSAPFTTMQFGVAVSSNCCKDSEGDCAGGPADADGACVEEEI